MNSEQGQIFTSRFFVSAFAVTAVLFVLLIAWINWSAPPAPDPGGIIAVVTMVPMPTATPLAAGVPTFDPYASTPTPTLMPGQISIGAYVQISGTQGEGLRIRSQPGLEGKQLFLGFDTEAYVVMDGPTELDGYTWYKVAAINDETRVGWAASNFLTLTTSP